MLFESLRRKRRARKDMERKFQADSPETERVREMLGVTEEQEKEILEQHFGVTEEKRK
jgi:hypothetical protein